MPTYLIPRAQSRTTTTISHRASPSLRFASTLVSAGCRLQVRVALRITHTARLAPLRFPATALNKDGLEFADGAKKSPRSSASTPSARKQTSSSHPLRMASPEPDDSYDPMVVNNNSVNNFPPRFPQFPGSNRRGNVQRSNEALVGAGCARTGAEACCGSRLAFALRRGRWTRAGSDPQGRS